MGVYESSDKVQKWRYHVTGLTIIADDIVEIPKERVVGLSIVHDYINHFFPIIRLELVLEADIFYMIVRNKNECKFNLRIDKYYQGLDSNSKSIYKKFIDGSFDIIQDENEEDMLASLKRDEASSNYRSQTNSQVGQLEKATNKIALHLSKADIINGTKTNINKILLKSNVTDVISYLFTEAKINNLVMAPADNMTLYDYVLLPPLSMLKSLSFLDTYYGIYKASSIIYFGIDYTYIIPYNGLCKAFTSGETKNTTIVVPIGSNASHSSEMGTLKKSDAVTSFIVADYQSIEILNNSISNNILSANDIQVVDPSSGSSDAKGSKAKVKIKTNKRVLENRTENEFISEMYVAQSNALNTTIKVRAADYDLAALSPNKRFQFMFEEPSYAQKYKGNYILAREEHTFSKDGEDLAVDSVLYFNNGDNL